MKKIFLTLLLSFSAFSAEPVSTPESFKASGGNVDFYAVGKPSMLKIHGEGKSVEGTLSKKASEVSGIFTMKMSDFSSGLSLRDSHTKNKVFEVEKYPTATLTIKPTTVKSGEKTKFSGLLNFHGVEKEVQGELVANLEKDKVGMESNFTILLTDFNIQPPEFAGMKINNDVRIEAKADAKL